MSDPSNKKYYVDGTHFTAEGYSVWADYVVKAVKQIKSNSQSSVCRLLRHLTMGKAP
jgi:hypothetical protein